jgi:decaprenyl-phosphate phosphoribosyltransferase
MVGLELTQARPADHRPLWRALLVTARPKQWTKNLLVLAAPTAAGSLTTVAVAVPSILTLVAVTLAASGCYYVNDAADAISDRHHPRKHLRPVAAGDISVTAARVIGGVLVVTGIAVASDVNQRTGLVVGLYVAISLAYSFAWKNIAVVDLACVASGFVLRAIAGGTSTGLPLSRWFLLVAAGASLFVVSGKRRGELGAVAAGAEPAESRRVLSGYTARHLDVVWRVSAGFTVAVYAFWAFANTARLDPLFAQLSVVPLAGAIGRYGMLIERGRAETPEEVLLADWPMQVLGSLWLVLFAVGAFLRG